MGGGGKHYSAPKEVEIPVPEPVENKTIKATENKRRKNE